MPCRAITHGAWLVTGTRAVCGGTMRCPSAAAQRYPSPVVPQAGYDCPPVAKRPFPPRSCRCGVTSRKPASVRATMSTSGSPKASVQPLALHAAHQRGPDVGRPIAAWETPCRRARPWWARLRPRTDRRPVAARARPGPNAGSGRRVRRPRRCRGRRWRGSDCSGCRRRGGFSRPARGSCPTGWSCDRARAARAAAISPAGPAAHNRHVPIGHVAIVQDKRKFGKRNPPFLAMGRILGAMPTLVVGMLSRANRRDMATQAWPWHPLDLLVTSSSRRRSGRRRAIALAQFWRIRFKRAPNRRFPPTSAMIRRHADEPSPLSAWCCSHCWQPLGLVRPGRRFRWTRHHESRPAHRRAAGRRIHRHGVAKVNKGILPTDMVESTFLWAKKNGPQVSVFQARPDFAGKGGGDRPTAKRHDDRTFNQTASPGVADNSAGVAALASAAWWHSRPTRNDSAHPTTAALSITITTGPCRTC